VTDIPATTGANFGEYTYFSIFLKDYKIPEDPFNLFFLEDWWRGTLTTGNIF